MLLVSNGKFTPTNGKNRMSWMAPADIVTALAVGTYTIHKNQPMKSLIIRSLLIVSFLFSPINAHAAESDDPNMVRFGDGSYYDSRNEDVDRQAEEEKIEQPNTPCLIYAPTVTNVKSTSAEIQWLTNKQSSGVVYVSTQSGVDIYSPYVWFTIDPEVGKFHSTTLTDLQPNTTYYFIITSRDMWGNVCSVTEHSFTTTN